MSYLVLCEDRQHKPGLLACRDLILAVKVAVLGQHLQSCMHLTLVCTCKCVQTVCNAPTDLSLSAKALRGVWETSNVVQM